MKGEPTPAWDHGTRGSSPFWLGEGRVPSENVATLELVVFGDWGTWIPASRKGECGWEASTEYHCTPTKVFLKFSQSLRRPPTVANYGSRLKPFNWLKGRPTGWLNLPSPTWSEKVHPHLPLGGDLGEGTWYCRTRGLKMAYTTHVAIQEGNDDKPSNSSVVRQTQIVLESQAKPCFWKEIS